MCRDTQQLESNGQPGIGVIANTASYSGMPSDKSDPQTLVLSSPQGFGSLFYQLEADECPEFGLCSDNTRWVGWPNTGPVVTFAFDGDLSLPLAFFTLFGQFLPYGDGFRVDDVFALFAKVSRNIQIEEKGVTYICE